MSNTILTTNMSLPVPTVGVDAGPDYALNINSALALIDAHDHSNGKGVQVTPAGININSDLTFNSSYSATNLKKSIFTSQAAALSGTNFVSVVGGNLYFNDGSGNQIQITSGGGVAGTPGGIGSLTSPAAATYSSSTKTFTWAADSLKAAAMDHGAMTIRETNVASSQGVTIQASSGFPSSYSLTLPAALPASTQYLTSSNTGALSFSSADSIGSAMTATGANAVANSRTRTVTTTGADPGIGGVAMSLACNTISTTSNTFVDMTNQSLTLTTSGRPVFVGLMSTNNSGQRSWVYCGNQTAGNDSTVDIQFVRDSSTSIAILEMQALANQSITIPATSFHQIDVVTAGTHTYKAQWRAQTSTGGSPEAIGNSFLLVAYEL